MGSFEKVAVFLAQVVAKKRFYCVRRVVQIMCILVGCDEEELILYFYFAFLCEFLQVDFDAEIFSFEQFFH